MRGLPLVKLQPGADLGLGERFRVWQVPTYIKYTTEDGVEITNPIYPTCNSAHYTTLH